MITMRQLWSPVSGAEGETDPMRHFDDFIACLMSQESRLKIKSPGQAAELAYLQCCEAALSYRAVSCPSLSVNVGIYLPD